MTKLGLSLDLVITVWPVPVEPTFSRQCMGLVLTLCFAVVPAVENMIGLVAVTGSRPHADAVRPFAAAKSVMSAVKLSSNSDQDVCATADRFSYSQKVVRRATGSATVCGSSGTEIRLCHAPRLVSSEPPNPRSRPFCFTDCSFGRPRSLVLYVSCLPSP